MRGPVLSRKTTEFLSRSAAAPVRVLPVAEPARANTLADAERAHIIATLSETNWVIGGPRGAAAQLGLPRTTLLARMQRLEIAGSSAISQGNRMEGWSE